MAAVIGRLRLGFVDLVEERCSACPCPDERPDEAHVHLRITALRRWHPGYWVYVARAMAAELARVRVRVRIGRAR